MDSNPSTQPTIMNKKNNRNDDDIDRLTGTPADELTTSTVITSPRMARTPMTTVTCSLSSHSIPINALLPPPLLLDFDSASPSTTTRFLQQNWLPPLAIGQDTMDAQQQQQQQKKQQQQPAFLSPQPFCYSYYGSLESTSYKSPSCASSYFDFTHVDVIMDDGSRQKRTVSLSTVPRFPSIPSILSPRAVNETTRLLASPTSYDDRHHHQHLQPTTATAQQQLTKSKIMGSIGEDSDDDESISNGNGTQLASSIKSSLLYSRLRSILTLTTGQQQVLKCSLAYLLGSLFTFVPVLHDWIDNGGNGRNQVASHMAATVTVFFNPAKSVGGMVEAAGLGWIMTLGALSVCLASLWTTEYLMGTQHQPYLSYGITLFGWLLTSTLFLAFLKAQYARRPSVGTASSLAFILLFPILVREHTLDGSEYGRQKIQDNFAIVATGTAISAAVCVMIWPQTATNKFNSNMNDSLSSFRVLLKLLTKTFLLDTDLPDFKANEPLTKAIKTDSASFSALQSSLREARLEWWWWARWDDKDDEDAHECMVKSMQRLTLHIGGLRKSCGLQFDRIHQTATATATASTTTAEEEENDSHVMYNVRADNNRRKFERIMNRERSMTPLDITTAFNYDDTSNSIKTSAKQPGHINDDDNNNNNNDGLTAFLRTVGPPMKSLAFTCKQTILHLQTHMTPSSSNSTPSFATLQRNLGLALDTFEQSQQKALLRLYSRYRYQQQHSTNEGHSSNASKMAAAATPRRPSTLDPTPSAVQTQLLTHLPADDLFLVYFFVFCLMAFAKELTVLVTCMEQALKQRKESISLASLVFRLVIGFRWLVTAVFRPSLSSPSHHSSHSNNNKHTTDTLHTPTPRHFIHHVRMHIWGFFTWFRKHQVRYAIKAGLAALLLASLAFLPSTQVYFQAYRMEWTLITALAVMTPTVGGTNFNAVLRVGATILGVAMGALSYHLFSGFCVIWLVVLTWLISLPCFWLILHEPKYGKFGQFTLLAYNLVILYEYNHPELNVFDLAYQRFVAVSLGVVIGLVVTTYIWPYSARQHMRFGLSDLLLGFSRQYYQMNTNNGNKSNHIDDSGDDDMTTMVAVTIPKQQQQLQHLGKDTALLDLQQQLHRLSALLNHTPNEPRLKGRFPFQTYQMMLRTCQSILDNLVMMQMVTHQQIMMKDSNDEQWTDMVGNVVLYFYVLASALQLKTPLPPYLPPANMARKQLINRLQSSSSTTETTSPHLHDASASSSPSYMAYYAYVVLMETMLYDMDQLGCHMKALYGSMMPQWQP